MISSYLERKRDLLEAAYKEERILVWVMFTFALLAAAASALLVLFPANFSYLENEIVFKAIQWDKQILTMSATCFVGSLIFLVCILFALLEYVEHFDSILRKLSYTAYAVGCLYWVVMVFLTLSHFSR